MIRQCVPEKLEGSTSAIRLPASGRLLFVAPILLALIFVSSPIDALAQFDESLRFRNLSPDDGLPATEVMCILKSRDGFVWMGTGDGAARFDGTTVRLFQSDASDPTTITPGIVRDMVEGADGQLWLATDSGLSRYDPAMESFRRHVPDPADPSSLSSNRILSLAFGPDGDLWVGTFGAGIDRLDTVTGKSENFMLDPATPDKNVVYDLLFDHEGVLWIASQGNGLHRHDPRTGEHKSYHAKVDDPTAILHDEVRCLFEDSKNRLWIGSAGGLNKLNRGTDGFRQYKADVTRDGALRASTVSGIAEDSTGKLWLSTDGGGLAEFFPEQDRFLHHLHRPFVSDAVMSDAARCVYVAPNDEVWAGYFPHGAQYVHPVAASFSVMRELPNSTNSLPSGSVLSLAEHTDGRIWIGTDGGGAALLNRQSGNIEIWNNQPRGVDTSKAAPVLGMMVNSDEDVWFGLYNGGITRINIHTGESRNYFPDAGKPGSLPHRHVWNVMKDSKGTIWIATMGAGLARYLPETDSFYAYPTTGPDDKSLREINVWCSLEDSEGRLWFGTSNGLRELDRESGSFTHHIFDDQRSNGLSHPWITALFQDSRGVLWVGTYGGGLHQFDPETGRFTQFTSSAGTLDDMVCSIMEDESGFLWISTNSGLSKLNPEDATVVTFNKETGMPGNQFNRFSRLHARDGRMYFGLVDGLVSFDPDQIRVPDAPPIPVITDLDVMNKRVVPGADDSPLTKSILQTDHIRVPHKSGTLAFQFGVLDFATPTGTQITYKLEGFDSEWQVTGKERLARYTNLDPGEYQLIVRAQNPFGAQSESDRVLAISVIPPFYLTWWFELGLGVGLIGLGIGAMSVFARSREWRRKELEHSERTIAADLNRQLEDRVQIRTRELEAALKDLESFSYTVSHDLQNPLRNINGFSHLALSRFKGTLGEGLQRHLEIIRDNSVYMSGLIQDLLSFSRTTRSPLNRQNTNLTLISEGIFAELKEAEPDRTVQIVIEAELHAASDPALTSVVMRNLIENAWKYTQENPEAKLEIGRTDRNGESWFHVRDNGIGFDVEHAGKLFQPFQRLHNGRHFKGTGIGLATVHRVLQRHGGRIEAEAKLQEGATFFFHFGTSKGIEASTDVGAEVADEPHTRQAGN